MTHLYKLCCLLACFFFFSVTLTAQVPDSFRQDFSKALKNPFSDKALNDMFSNYQELLTPHSDVTRLAAGIKGVRFERYPLETFKEDALYRDNIRTLLASKNENQRLLAYLVIASAGDRAFESTLLANLKTEKNESCLIWCGMGLLYLETSHTTPLFDFLVEHETFGDAHMLPLFNKLDPDSLQHTAYLRIGSRKPMARILAAQTLSFTKPNAKTDSLLKKAVKEWDLDVKGYAIYSVKELQLGDLLPTLRPWLDKSETRSIAMEALANSPTAEDRQYLVDLVNSRDTVSTELLDCFYESKRIDNVRYWLKILETKKMPKDYYFSISRQPLLQSDSLLPDLLLSLQRIKDTDVLDEVLRALKGRTDEASMSALIGFLNHNSSTVRYWAANTLQESRSDRLKAMLPALISDPVKRVTPLTNLAIANGVDTLQAIYMQIYQADLGLDWERSAVEYLSAFPQARQRELFRSILSEKGKDSFIKREAAMGLGRLKDQSSATLVIEACKEESAASDFNARMYLRALALMKGDAAKAAVMAYTRSNVESIKALANELLASW